MSAVLGLRNFVALFTKDAGTLAHTKKKPLPTKGMRPGTVFAAIQASGITSFRPGPRIFSPLKFIDTATFRRIALAPTHASDAVDDLSKEPPVADAHPEDEDVSFGQSPAAQEMLDNLRKEQAGRVREQGANDGVVEPDGIHNRPNAPPVAAHTSELTSPEPNDSESPRRVLSGRMVNPVLEFVIRTLTKDRPEFAPLFREAYDATRLDPENGSSARILIISRATGDIELAFKEVLNGGCEPGLEPVSLNELRSPAPVPDYSEQARRVQPDYNAVNPVLEFVIRTITKDRPDFAPLFREAYDATRLAPENGSSARILITSRVTGEIELAFKEVLNGGFEPGLELVSINELKSPAAESPLIIEKPQVPQPSQDLSTHPAWSSAESVPLHCPKPQRYTAACSAPA